MDGVTITNSHWQMRHYNTVQCKHNAANRTAFLGSVSCFRLFLCPPFANIETDKVRCKSTLAESNGPVGDAFALDARQTLQMATFWYTVICPTNVPPLRQMRNKKDLPHVMI